MKDQNNNNKNDRFEMLEILRKAVEDFWDKAEKSWEGIEDQLGSLKDETMEKIGNSQVVEWAKGAVRNLKEKGEEFPKSARELWEKISKEPW
jgi:hypothetical protein